MKASLTSTATGVPPTVVPQEHDSHFARGVVLMLACLAFFTANALLIKYLGTYMHIGAWPLVFVRGFVGLAFVMLWYGRKAGLRTSRVFTQPLLIARGAIGAVGLICFYYTIPLLGAGVATLVSTTYVVFGAVFAACFLVREKLSPMQFVWLLVSLGGIALLTDARAGFSFALGVALLGAVAAGLVIVIIRYLHRTEATPTIFAAQCVYAMLFSAPLVFPELFQLSVSQLGWTLVASLLAAFGQLAMTQSFRYLSVSMGGAFHLSVPVWVAIGGYFFFDERLNETQLLGALLVLVGCFKAVRR